MIVCLMLYKQRLKYQKCIPVEKLLHHKYNTHTHKYIYKLPFEDHDFQKYFPQNEAEHGHQKLLVSQTRGSWSEFLLGKPIYKLHNHQTNINETFLLYLRKKKYSSKHENLFQITDNLFKHWTNKKRWNREKRVLNKQL